VQCPEKIASPGRKEVCEVGGPGPTSPTRLLGAWYETGEAPRRAGAAEVKGTEAFGQQPGGPDDVSEVASTPAVLVALQRDPMSRAGISPKVILSGPSPGKHGERTIGLIRRTGRGLGDLGCLAAPREPDEHAFLLLQHR